MEIIISGMFRTAYQQKKVELNGTPIDYVLGVMDTQDGPLPITAWGEKKCAMLKQAAQTGEPMKIVVQMQAKPQTFTNSEGETVTHPNLTLKLYSFLTMPKGSFVPQAPKTSLPPPQPPKPNMFDETGCFRGFNQQQKAEFLKPVEYSSTAYPELDSVPGLKEIF